MNFKEHKGEAYGVGWNHISPNLILSSGQDSTIKLYDISKGVLTANLIGHKSLVYNVTWHPTLGNLFASASSDQTLKIWDLKMGKAIKTVRASNSDILCCDFNKYENIIATSAANGEINIFDLRGTGDIPIIKLQGHKMSTKKCMFSPHNASILASVSYDMNVIVWDIKISRPLNIFKHHREFIMGLDFSVFENNKIATASWDRTMWIFKWDENLVY